MKRRIHEAASLAGHLGLSRLVWIYDDNHISAGTDLAFTEDVAETPLGYNWHVQNLGEKATISPS
ncbi:MAG: hypothetical protein R3C26_18630 [Calditrichia bacterium]